MRFGLYKSKYPNASSPLPPFHKPDENPIKELDKGWPLVYGIRRIRALRRGKRALHFPGFARRAPCLSLSALLGAVVCCAALHVIARREVTSSKFGDLHLKIAYHVRECNMKPSVVNALLVPTNNVTVSAHFTKLCRSLVSSEISFSFIRKCTPISFVSESLHEFPVVHISSHTPKFLNCTEKRALVRF